MSGKKDGMPEVSASNTKKELLDAFDQLKRMLEEKAQGELKPEAQVASRRAAEVVAAADELCAMGVVKAIGELKAGIVKILTDLSHSLETETDRYGKINDAIAIKEKELKEIYDIDQSACALAALIEAQKQKRQAFETEMTQRRKELEEEIEQTRAEWEKETQARQAAAKDQEATDKKARERQKEEFAYAFQREQELAKIAQHDAAERLGRELAVKREEVEKELALRENAVADRERAVAAKEQLLVELQKKVDSFPEELEAQQARAVKETAEKLREEAKMKEALLLKEAEGDQKVSSTKIEALEELVTEQAGRITGLTSQIEKAYGKVQEIAVKALEGPAHKQTLTNIEQMIEKSKA